MNLFGSTETKEAVAWLSQSHKLQDLMIYRVLRTNHLARTGSNWTSNTGANCCTCDLLCSSSTMERSMHNR